MNQYSKIELDWVVNLSFRGGASARQGEIHKRNCGSMSFAMVEFRRKHKVKQKRVATSMREW